MKNCTAETVRIIRADGSIVTFRPSGVVLTAGMLSNYVPNAPMDGIAISRRELSWSSHCLVALVSMYGPILVSPEILEVCPPVEGVYCVDPETALRNEDDILYTRLIAA